MNISSNISSIQSSQVMMNQSATNIAGSNADLSKEIPKQIAIEKDVAANASVIKTQDDMLGSLLDIKA